MKFKKIYIEITNHCNLSCSFCSKDNREKKWMSVAEFEHILKEIKPYTKTIYLHVKGEPLLHKELDSLLSLTDAYSFRVNITTNGIFLSKKVESPRSARNCGCSASCSPVPAHRSGRTVRSPSPSMPKSLRPSGPS